MLAKSALEDPARAAEGLVPLIDTCLRQAKLRVADLDRLVVTAGPGRFTSLRVALAAAHGLALARAIPIVGIDSFEALAASLPDGDEPLIAGIDAGRGEVAVRWFNKDDDRLRVGPPKSLMRDLPPLPWRFAGTGFEEFGIHAAVATPDPVALARLGRMRAPSANVQPIYLRPPAIETVRPLQRDELKAAAELHARCFAQAWDQGTLGQFLDDPTVRALALGPRAVPLGVALIRIAADEAEILTICISPDDRSRGLGYRLLQSAQRMARQAGAAKIHLEVAEDNDRAIALYKKAGFTTTGRRKFYYHRPIGGDVDALIFSTSLV